MDGISEIKCTVNGKPVTLPFVPGEMLSDMLRERLGLTGTKIGCNEAECGSCTVLVDGEPILSCTYPALRVNGKSVLTIEGLAAPKNGDEVLHPLQEAFILHGAVQCGFCIPGQIMTAYALLRDHPDPSPEDIRFALKDTLCRCAGYPTIERAVLAAAKAARTGQPVEPPEVPVSARAQRVVGQVKPRPEALEKVTGKALFTDDLKFEGMLHGRAKRVHNYYFLLTKTDSHGNLLLNKLPAPSQTCYIRQLRRGRTAAPGKGRRLKCRIASRFFFVLPSHSQLCLRLAAGEAHRTRERGIRSE